MTDPLLDFTGRSALITGAASGIGAALARWLDARGIAVLHLVDTNEAGLAGLDLSCKVVRHTADVADPDFWAGFERTVGTLDHAAINAGIAGGGGEIADLSFADWRAVIAVNLDGAFLTLASALRLMRANGKGSAVVTASAVGIKPVAGVGAYGPAKAAVAHMARIAALENASRGIRVNAVAPAGVDTAVWDSGAAFRDAAAEHGREATIAGMGSAIPRGRFATADEVAGDIGYLLSDMAVNVTGTVLVSDGGFSI